MSTKVHMLSYLAKVFRIETMVYVISMKSLKFFHVSNKRIVFLDEL